MKLYYNSLVMRVYYACLHRVRSSCGIAIDAVRA